MQNCLSPYPNHSRPELLYPPRQHGWWNRQADLFCGLEIDQQTQTSSQLPSGWKIDCGFAIERVRNASFLFSNDSLKKDQTIVKRVDELHLLRFPRYLLDPRPRVFVILLKQLSIHATDIVSFDSDAAPGLQSPWCSERWMTQKSFEICI
jgi:hypothetical protein